MIVSNTVTADSLLMVKFNYAYVRESHLKKSATQIHYMGPLLLTKYNFNPSMDK